MPARERHAVVTTDGGESRGERGVGVTDLGAGDAVEVEAAGEDAAAAESLLRRWIPRRRRHPPSAGRLAMGRC